MRTLTLLLLLASAPAVACDFSAGAGAAHRYQDGYSGASVKVACAFKDGKLEVAAHGFGSQNLYNGLLKLDPYVALSAQRVFTWRKDKFVRPFIAVGFMLKVPDRCHDTWITKPNGTRKRNFDFNCNRLVPEGWSYALTAGIGLGKHVRLSLVNHWSNGGISESNTGQDFALIEGR